MNNHRKCRIVKPYYLDISINSENKTLFTDRIEHIKRNKTSLLRMRKRTPFYIKTSEKSVAI